LTVYEGSEGEVVQRVRMVHGVVAPGTFSCNLYRILPGAARQQTTGGHDATVFCRSQ